MPRPLKSKPKRAFEAYSQLTTDERAIFDAMCWAATRAQNSEPPKPRTRKPRNTTAPPAAT